MPAVSTPAVHSTPAAALRQLAGIVTRPRVLGALAAYWAVFWTVLALGYHLAWGDENPGMVVPVATYDATLWTLQAAAAFAGGWLVPVSRRPTARQVGAIVALASALVVARMAVQQVMAPLLGTRKWSLLEETLFYYPRHTLVVTLCVVAGSALRSLVHGWGRQAEVSALELSVSRARLEALRNRVGPDFLLGCLDAISRRMEDAPAAADALLVRMSELLRERLRTGSVPEVPLSDELALAALYAEVWGECCGHAVRLRVDVPGSVARWPVPPCTVSWLLESALVAARDRARPVELAVRVGQGG
ncbi:MAG TPA: histidine kinase, partial [Longimicrobium sp.]|nr:histidine kinase [Longimicrobium sp.]